jgi:hypothetical protein
MLIYYAFVCIFFLIDELLVNRRELVDYDTFISEVPIKNK